MKYVILNASPRPNSNISQMLGIVRNELLACGDRVLYIDVCKLQFRPCIGCMKCRSTHDCVMPDDDAKQVLQLVQDCDALIVGSPCYWGNMTGQLKMLFDRWVYGMMDHSESGYPIPLLKGKKAVCFPGLENALEGAKVVKTSVCRDGRIITAKGMGAAFEFAFALTELLFGPDSATELKKGVQYN